jgi:hypothetical protein
MCMSCTRWSRCAINSNPYDFMTAQFFIFFTMDDGPPNFNLISILLFLFEYYCYVNVNIFLWVLYNHSPNSKPKKNLRTKLLVTQLFSFHSYIFSNFSIAICNGWPPVQWKLRGSNLEVYQCTNTNYRLLPAGTGYTPGGQRVDGYGGHG